MIRALTIAFLFLNFLNACSTQRHAGIGPGTGLQWVGSYELPNKMQFAGTTVGGLSGIDYNPNTNEYYLISDDPSAINPARFYTARIFTSAKGIDSMRLLQTFYLLNSGQRSFPAADSLPTEAPDPESIRYHPKKNTLVWSSEGVKTLRKGDSVFRQPFIHEINLNGSYRQEYRIPDLLKVYRNSYGIRHNGSFEALSFSHNGKWLWAAMEEPLYQDGERAGMADSGARIRVAVFDADGKGQLKQLAYPIDAVAQMPVPANGFKVNGVVEVLWLHDEQFLFVERSFSEGHEGCVIKIYHTDFAGATDVQYRNSLKDANYQAAKKTLLFDSRSLAFPVYNIEGICFGPRIQNKASLLLVADNNFSDRDRSQFLLFTVE